MGKNPYRQKLHAQSETSFVKLASLGQSRSCGSPLALIILLLLGNNCVVSNPANEDLRGLCLKEEGCYQDASLEKKDFHPAIEQHLPKMKDSGPEDQESPKCPDSLFLCGQDCVDLSTDIKNCGACESPCDKNQICILGSCKVESCAQKPCPKGSYCDFNSNLCQPGCVADDNCLELERCLKETHTCVCDIGYHRCQNKCVSSFSLASCGKNCSPCPSPPHGKSTCDGSQCGITCEKGYHLCGKLCVADESIDHCGTACDPCPKVANGTPQCVGSPLHCSTQCTPGFSQLYCYPDGDGDGYGVTSQKVTYCDSVCPKAWSAKPGDCDDALNKVHPGQTFFFTKSYGSKKSFDYNCDKKEEKWIKPGDWCNTVWDKDQTSYVCAKPYAWRWTDMDPACGVVAEAYSCIMKKPCGYCQLECSFSDDVSKIRQMCR